MSTASATPLVLLFTDIVDSTQLGVQVGDQVMNQAWAAHDRRARELVRRWAGREIGRTDGFLLLFASVPAALGFARDYHRMLTTLTPPLQARVGLHQGLGTLRENATADREAGATPFEVDGVVVPTAARVMSLALGGQTLLSDAAASQAGGPPWALASRGHWLLKGMEQPIEVHELLDAADAPPRALPDSAKGYRVVQQGGRWLPLHEVRNSLPLERDQFVGRAPLLLALRRQFERGARLVSVLGIGGTGKTRLAVRFGHLQLGDYPGGVWFCDLAQAASIDGIAQAVAQGLQIPLSGADPVAQLTHALAGHGRCLVILDNFEQVAAHARATVGRWLDGVAEVHFVVTTREVLGLPGEAVFDLPPMGMDEGAELFVTRAAALRVDAAGVGPADAEAIDRLVRLLDGLPLAIELAAARSRVMSPAQLLQRMHDKFRLLASRGGRQERQSTLRNAFDWSWDLLSPCDRSALAQLSVFEGGFTLDAAEAVLDLSEFAAAPWAVDVVHSLVNHSLVRVAESEARFELLGTLQEYAAERLRVEAQFPGSGAVFAAATRARHYRFFAALDERAAVARRCIEIGNLEAACRRAVEQGDAPAALDTLALAWAALKLRGPYGSGAELAVRVAGMPGLPAAGLATTHWVAGSACVSLGQAHRAKQHFDAGLAAAQAHADRPRCSLLLCALGEWYTTSGLGDEARRCLDQSFALAGELGAPLLQLRALNALGALAQDQSRWSDAQAHYEAALALARELDDLRWQGGLLGNLGGIAHAQGQLDAARAHYEQAVELSARSGDRRWQGNNLCNLGLLHHDQGRHDEARRQFEAALATARELGTPRLEGMVLCNLGIVAQAQGEATAALDYQERAVGSAVALGDRHAEGLFRMTLGPLYAGLGRASEARACLAIGAQQLEATGDRMNLALLLCTLAELESADGAAAAARMAVERAEALAAELGVGAHTELGRAIAQARRRTG